MRYTAATVLAMEFCADRRDIQEARYQYGRTTRPVYVLNEVYWCAIPVGLKPPTHHTLSFSWYAYVSSFAESIGWQIYRSVS